MNACSSQIIGNETLKADVYRLQNLLKIVTLCFDIKYYKNPYDLFFILVRFKIQFKYST